MSDKLKWLDQHLVLLEHSSVGETVAKEQYKLRPDLEGTISLQDTPEECLKKLTLSENWKDACEYLAYSMHRRAAVWWGYNCLLKLYEEVDAAPAVEIDIADIGKPAPHAIPDWAKNPPPPELVGEARVDAMVKDIEAQAAELMALVPKEIQDYYNAVVNEMYSQFKDQYGMTPMELLEKAIENFDPNASLVDEANSPIVNAEQELKEQIEKMRTETVDLIKSVIPPKVPAHAAKMRAESMDAVYRWIAVPDEVNSQKAMDVGNACPDTPAGLLSLTAFWSFGNLTPTGKQFVPTPAGLSANGLNSVLLNAALTQGGTLKPVERFKLFYEIGLEIAYGKNNWGASLEDKEAPHEKIVTKDENDKAYKHTRFRGEPV